ncbi:MAG: hypothetical protein R3C49_25755 [Planctomycetaceae bacterium]
MKYTVLLLIGLAAIASPLQACNVPVFRYALERWQTDSSEVIVFHDGEFSQTQQEEVRELTAKSERAHGKFILADVSQTPDDAVSSLWKDLQNSKAELPWVVIRSNVAEKSVNCWRGTLADSLKLPVLDSPVRRELSQRLLSGHSVVWLMLKGRDGAETDRLKTVLTAELNKLGTRIPIPDGIGLPGSELFSDIPLLMKFSVIEIDPGDAQETFLTGLLQSFAPEAVQEGQALVVPVFGRGRALEVIPGRQLNEGLIEDLTVYLSGACSCQVKERNPGFDLITMTDWETELYGEDAEDVRSQIQPPKSGDAPVLLTIPPGSKSRNR